MEDLGSIRQQLAQLRLQSAWENYWDNLIVASIAVGIIFAMLIATGLWYVGMLIPPLLVLGWTLGDWYGALKATEAINEAQ